MIRKKKIDFSGLKESLLLHYDLIFPNKMDDRYVFDWYPKIGR